MSEVNVEPIVEKVNPEGTPPQKPQEVIELEAHKSLLESEISGLEGTKTSILEDIERARQARRQPIEPPTPPIVPPTPPVDVEALKSELDERFKEQLNNTITPILEAQAKITQELIDSKKVIVQSLTERMASASGSGGPSSPDSIVENEVELSKEQKEIVQELGIKNPRYFIETEVN